LKKRFSGPHSNVFFLTKKISIEEIGVQALPLVIEPTRGRKHLIFTCSLKNPQRGEERRGEARRGDETNNTLLPTSPLPVYSSNSRPKL
jgi:hypothetical protein